MQLLLSVTECFIQGFHSQTDRYHNQSTGKSMSSFYSSEMWRMIMCSVRKLPLLGRIHQFLRDLRVTVYFPGSAWNGILKLSGIRNEREQSGDVSYSKCERNGLMQIFSLSCEFEPLAVTADDRISTCCSH